MGWFEVDKSGLGKLLEIRGKSFVIIELLQNAWDSDAKRVDVTLDPAPGEPLVYLKVQDDDPVGFKNLAHAFTLFAESEKKNDAAKRGRFNLGEKLVLSMCREAKISSTTGTYCFSTTGERKKTNERTKEGSYFEGYIKMTREELREAESKIKTLLPPHNVKTFINGVLLHERMPIVVFETSLPTEIADDEGVPRKTIRKTQVRVFEPAPGENASIYELGIPVVETGDTWHVDVAQKIPLNFNRDNVTPWYLRTIRTMVLNQMHKKLSTEAASSTWVKEAVSDTRCSADAAKTTIQSRFGDKVVAFDPSDPEANKLAVAAGYTVVHGRTLSKDEWATIKRSDLIPAAGVVTPSPKPFSPDGKPLKVLEEDKWTDGIHWVVAYAKRLGLRLLKRSDIVVSVVVNAHWPFSATYGRGSLHLNVGRLGYAWFDKAKLQNINALLIHEFAHEFCMDHLDEKYYAAICALGAHLVDVALTDPDFFK